jgi:glycosyltransferase involved in cell wall biosynthesis
LREVVPHGEVGLRFTAGDPDDLVDVTARVLSDGDLGMRLVAEAHDHVRRFDWLDVAERTAATYGSLLAEAVPARSLDA